MFSNRYSITSSIATSDETGNKGCIIMGWSLGLPEQAHELILASTAEELKKQNKFFLPYERNIPNDKLLADLRFSKPLNLLPIYFDKLPKSETVKSIASISVQMPINKDKDLNKAIRETKQYFVELYSVRKENVNSLLNNIKYSFEDLSELDVVKKTINVKIYCLEFPFGLTNELYFTFVVKNYTE